MAKIMDPILPILSILGYWAIILGSFGGSGRYRTLKILVLRLGCTLGVAPPVYTLNQPEIIMWQPFKVCNKIRAIWSL